MSAELFRKIQEAIQEIAPACHKVRLYINDGRIDLRIPRVHCADPTTPPNTTSEQPQRRHGPDFRTVIWDGVRFSFTPNQARAIQLLWQSMEEGFWDVSQEELAEGDKFASEGYVRNLFRSTPAWKRKLIIPGATKGMFRLNDGELLANDTETDQSEEE